MTAIICPVLSLYLFVIFLRIVLSWFPLSSGGILGTVVAVKDNEDEVTLKTDDASNTRIRVLKSSVVRILSDNQPATGETKPA